MPSLPITEQTFTDERLIRTWEQDGFRLDLYDTHVTDDGHHVLAYRLFDGEVDEPDLPVFEGADFGCSPMHAIDANATIRSLLNFLSLRPGDTDPDYFDSYTPRQVAWRDYRAEDLALLAFEWEYAGTLIHGTLRPEDLIPAMHRLLTELDRRSAEHLTSGDDPDDTRVWESLTVDGTGSIPDDLAEHAGEMVEWLADHLDACAPWGYRFGSIEGDPADFGYWDDVQPD